MIPLPVSEFEVSVTVEHVSTFLERGFVHFPRISSEVEVEWLREVYVELLKEAPAGYLDGVFDLSRPYGTTDAPLLGQMLLPERRVPQFEETLMYRNARQIAARLLEVAQVELESWSHLIFKGAGSPAQTPWHQDESYWDVHMQYHATACWFALDDVDTRNGCLWYVPGSHLGPLHRHRHLGGDPRIHVLEICDDVDTRDAVAVPLAAGGIVFHHPRALHHAGGNDTPAMRRAWGMSFQTPPRRRDEPADHPWWHEGRQAHARALARR